EGTTVLTEFKPLKNTYEFEAVYEVKPGSDQKVGFNLCVSDANKMVLGYDAKTSNVFIDRTQSGYVNFNSKFPRVINAPVQLKENKISFHVFVDQLSLEVFVNDGDVVLTSLMFPNPYFQKGIELFSINESSVLQSFNGWELNSIWEEELGTGILDRRENIKSIDVYPNPANDKIHFTLNAGPSRTATAKVINLLGQTLKEKTIFTEKSPSVIDISDLKTGHYILSVLNDNEISTQQFIKVN
ncbi:MAG: GH32 C-terminal domain-containing protein, partial [Bacteroidales bacterium]